MKKSMSCTLAFFCILANDKTYFSKFMLWKSGQFQKSRNYNSAIKVKSKRDILID